MGTVDRRQGSDRPRSARRNENIDQVNDMVPNQEDQPELTVQSVKYDGRETFLVICCPHYTKGSAAEML